MIQRLVILSLTLLSLIGSIFGWTVNYSSDYGSNNYLLYIFLVTLFLFWVWIYYKFTEDFYFDKQALLNSLTNLIIKSVCWFWFIAIFYTFFNSILLISTGETFLSDKVDLLYNLLILTSVMLAFIGIFHIFRLFNKMTGLIELFKEFIYEMRTGGKK